jgi:cell division protein ZapA (FtsZ GTPase activity inhibitor)
MGSENVGTASGGESVHIAIAADLLDQMIRELQCLERTYPTLQVAMATAAHELHEKLQALRILIEEIAVIDDPMRVAEHTSRAKSVISRLAWEVDRLVTHVEHTRHFLRPG